MTIKYFNIHDGSILTSKVDAGEQAVGQGRAIKIDCPDNIEEWRLSVNLETREVIIYGGIGRNNLQAVEYQTTLSIAKAAADKEKSDLLLALQEKQEEERKILQAQFNNLGEQ